MTGRVTGHEMLEGIRRGNAPLYSMYTAYYCRTANDVA
jgi:hypothetical protein